MSSVYTSRQEQTIARLAALAGGERQLEAAMKHVTNGRGGRVDEKKLIAYLVQRRQAARRILARRAAEAASG
jgi:hypothetical protein